jgi:hypothetical protein
MAIKFFIIVNFISIDFPNLLIPLFKNFIVFGLNCKKKNKKIIFFYKKL